jgi:hypothetical protein
MKGLGYIAVPAMLGALLLAGCASTTEFALNGPGHPARAGLTIGTPAGHLGLGAQQEAPSDTPAATAAAPQDDTRICRSVAGPTGSRLGTRSICMTLTEWQAKTQNDRDQVEDASSRALSTTLYGQD